MWEDILILKHGGIHIKKENRGKFTEYCGGKVTQECIERGKHSSNPTTRKRATFADNARTWKHQEGGFINKFINQDQLNSLSEFGTTIKDSFLKGGERRRLEKYPGYDDETLKNWLDKEKLGRAKRFTYPDGTVRFFIKDDYIVPEDDLVASLVLPWKVNAAVEAVKIGNDFVNGKIGSGVSNMASTLASGKLSKVVGKIFK